MCRRYRQRPSEVIGLSGALALDFDLAMAAVHRMEDQSRAQVILDKGGHPGIAQIATTA